MCGYIQIFKDCIKFCISDIRVWCLVQKMIVEEPFWTESTMDISFVGKQVGIKFLSKLVRREFKLLLYLTIGLHVLII